MGLFDKVIGTDDGKLTEAEGFAGVVLAAVAADGHVTEDEAQSLAVNLQRMKMYRATSPRQMNATFSKLVRLVRERGVDELVTRSAVAVPGDLKATAFANAADLLFADGEVTQSERQFLERIQKSLGVADDLAVKIVEVASIKNKG